MLNFENQRERVVISGIGLLASVGNDRESVWKAVRRGTSGARRLSGIPSIPDGLLIGAPVTIASELPRELKVTTLCRRVADEAICDAGINFEELNLDRFGCSISGHVGDLEWTDQQSGLNDENIRWEQRWLPNTTCSQVANRFKLRGPRLCHSTACATGLIEVLAAVRAIRDDQCDIALAGGAEAISPLFAAGFHKMRVLASHEDPTMACRPFHVDRQGFVMGEGAAMLVVERLSHALRRGAKIYAEVLSGKVLADAHHVTDLDAESESLVRLISDTLSQANLNPADVSYINAHGTATEQNDVSESTGIRRAFGKAASRVHVSSTKSMLGHLVNAAGSVELAITALALRDGFTPPTTNLTQQDPRCDIDCIPLIGRLNRFDHAVKLSLAFGGHLAAVALRRWNDPKSGFEYPSVRELSESSFDRPRQFAA